MKTRSRRSWALLAGMLLLAGCQRLNEERTLHVTVGAVHQIDISPPRFEQKVTARISSPGAPVSAYLVRQADSEAAKNRMMENKAPATPLAGKDKAEDITLEATVPAKTGFVLLLRADQKDADVAVKVTGR
jgi:hypothetical protein